MSFGKISTRFIASFLLLFTVTAGAVTLASIFYLRSSLTRADRGFLDNRLLEYWAVYRSGGINLIRRELSLEQLAAEDRLFAIRIASAENRTLYFYAPSVWNLPVLDNALSQLPMEENRIYTLDSRTPGGNLEIRNLVLGDGNQLQLIISAEERRGILARFTSGSLLMVLLIALPGLGVSAAAARRMVRPISDLAREIGNIQASEIGRVALSAPGAGEEIELLTQSFNEMSGQIARLIRGSRSGLDNIAHDLRTPITRLAQRAEMALQNPGNVQESEKALQVCLDEARHIEGIIKTVMEISRAENHMVPGKLETHDIVELASDLADLYSYSGPEGEGRIEVRAPQAPLYATVRPDAVRQILANYLDNAIKYSPEGSPIAIEIRRQEANICISVSDRGPGIEEEDLPHIWERMYRGDKSRSFPGSGLGLALVKALAEAHGGRVEAESTAGRGSRFSVLLPESEAPG